MDILLDFDGTCVKHAYPDIGEDIGAVPVLRELVENGHNLILFTMRSDEDFLQGDYLYEAKLDSGKYLSDAVKWFEEHEIPLFGIQEHPKQKEWTSSPKAYGQLIIDDICLGIPLVYPETGSFDRPYIHWGKTRELLVSGGFIK